MHAKLLANMARGVTCSTAAATATSGLLTGNLGICSLVNDS
jgi:hypothetical protein